MVVWVNRSLSARRRTFHSRFHSQRRTFVKYVYFFGAKKAEGDGSMKDLLGGKGAGLAEMTRIGLPVPGGFTITTECCDYYLKHERKYPSSLAAEVKKNL